ncbi:UvrD-helicase domain-containing protein, partial [Candidatus Nomurabacteria bacterium]|nr:UvrD-helicase domain-containing protein [Candidatus Nomurabacteria bacterium]
MKHLETLNERQRQVVSTTEGPVLILAGAGAGKTKTITHRILHLIKNGVAPSSILAITFTNKAAKEMRERVEKLLSEDKTLNLPVSMRERPFVSTFHSLGVHILKENAQLIGLNRHFGIFDRNDSKRAVRDAIIESNLDPKQFEPGKILSIISKQKGEMENVLSFGEKTGRDFIKKVVHEVWQKYESTLLKEKSLDFDDLLLKTAQILKKYPEVLKYYQNIWKYIHVDEYQDTNEVQYEITKMLSEKNKNLCVVGDIDQNIYSWRGANIKNILNFEKDYPEAKIVLLEENYRSTQTILSAANDVIAKNKNRREKRLFTKNNEGEKIGLFVASDETNEAKFIAKTSQELIKSGTDPKEIAVLYRANFQSRALEEAFLTKNVPYQVLGTRFFDRKEIKDLLSFIKLSLNRESVNDLKRVINVPPRGIGKTTLLKIVMKKEDDLPSATKAKIENFWNMISEIKNTIETEKTSHAIKKIIKIIKLDEYFKSEGEEGQERMENIKELVTLASKYDGLPGTEGIEKLIEDATLA